MNSVQSQATYPAFSVFPFPKELPSGLPQLEVKTFEAAMNTSIKPWQRNDSNGL